MRKYRFIIILILGILAGADTALAGFGITPPYVRNDSLTQGSEYTQEIILVRGDPVEDLKAEITINVPGIEEWFTVDRGFEFVLPKGKQQVPIQVTVHVPADAPYEQFKGNLRIRTSSLDENRSGVSIALGAQVDVNLAVVDHIYDFKVKRVEISELEEGYKKWWLDYPGKITFWMHIENIGNIDVTPTKVEFDIYNKKDKNHETILETVTNTNIIDPIAPFDTKKVAAFLPTSVKAGSYSVIYRVYKGEKVSRQGELNLSVLPEGLVPGYVKYGFEGLSSKDKMTLIAPVVGVGIITLLLIVFIILRIKNRKKKGSGTARPANPPTGRAPRQAVRSVRSSGATSARVRQQPVRRAVTQRQPVRPASPARRTPPQQPPRRAGGGGVIDLSRK